MLGITLWSGCAASAPEEKSIEDWRKAEKKKSEALQNMMEQKTAELNRIQERQQRHVQQFGTSSSTALLDQLAKPLDTELVASSLQFAKVLIYTL